MSENPEDQNPEEEQIVEHTDDQQEEGGHDSDAPRVARSVSNQPLISEEQAREHSAGGRIPSRPVRRPAPRARRMSLSLTRVDAWSVAKVSFMLSIAGGIIQVVAAGLVWMLLNVVGVFDQITQIVSSTGLDASGLDLANVFSLSTVLSAVTIFSIIEVVVITVLITIVALLYNVVSSLVGGIHVTLGDD